jgi:hypothetical protein
MGFFLIQEQSLLSGFMIDLGMNIPMKAYRFREFNATEKVVVHVMIVMQGQ